MMRINSKRSLDNSISAGNKQDVSRIIPPDAKDFPDVLQQRQASPWNQNLQDLLQRLDEIGARLAKSFSIYDLKSYKEVLRDFLNETQRKAYALRENTGWTRQGKSRIYQCIERIDQELEELSQLVLSKQQNSLKILDKLDQIRGLLVDLYS